MTCASVRHGGVTGSPGKRRDRTCGGVDGGYHADVVAFLSRPESYPHAPTEVEIIETHLSLLFLAGEFVYKLKRPIRVDYVDCRRLEDRRRSCWSEFEANQLLAPDVYLKVFPVTLESDGSLMLGGEGQPIEWLLVMRCLDNRKALDRIVEEGRVTNADLDRVCTRLAEFYRNQPTIEISKGDWLGLWHEKICLVRRSLTDPVFHLPSELVEPPLSALERFLGQSCGLIAARLAEGRIVDGHGDLKPEHIYLDDRVLLIDRLEFDERLRWSDPFDEIVFLGLECSRRGASWIAPKLLDTMAAALLDRPPDAILRFYRVYRSCMRARLMIEHLRDEAPREPATWPRKARAYLELAAQSLPLGDQS